MMGGPCRIRVTHRGEGDDVSRRTVVPGCASVSMTSQQPWTGERRRPPEARRLNLPAKRCRAPLRRVSPTESSVVEERGGSMRASRRKERNLTYTPRFVIAVAAIVVCLGALSVEATGRDYGLRDFESYEWTEVNPDAEWAPRAGLQAVRLQDSFFVLGVGHRTHRAFRPLSATASYGETSGRETAKG